MSRQVSTKKKLFAGIAALGVGIALVSIPVSGAEWSATDEGRVNVSAATLDIQLSDSNNTGTFELNYLNLYPGHAVAQSFTVKNVGTIPADVTVTPADINAALADAMAGAPNVTPADLQHLLVKIEAANGTVYQPELPILSSGGPSMLTQVSLGSLNAGQSRTYVMTVRLHPDASNNWQGAAFGYDAAVTLTQQ